MPLHTRRRPSVTAVLATGFAALLGARLASAAGVPTTRLLVLDADAGAVDAFNAGAVFELDTTAAPDAPLQVEAAATTGAFFQYVYGMAISPTTGKAYVSDIGLDPDGAGPLVAVPKIIEIDGTSGATRVVASGAPLVKPFGLTFLPDGRLVISDPEADPSNLGSDSYGGIGHGALFALAVDTCSTPPCAPVLLSNGTNHPFGPTIRTPFEDPIGVAYDKVTGLLYVADTSSDGGLGYLGAVYSVNPATGRVVALVSSTVDFQSLLGIAVRPNGHVLVADYGTAIGDSRVWDIDPTNADPQGNATLFTGGTQYSVIESVTVDAADNVYLADSGDYDASGNVVVPAAIWRVDELGTYSASAGYPKAAVSNSTDLLYPVVVVAVPVPVATSVTPPLVSGPTSVIITGSDLFPSLDIDFGQGIAVSNVDWAPAVPRGTALQAVLTPTPSSTVPSGRGCTAVADLTLTHPFDTTSTLVNAVQYVAAGTGSITPAPPASTKGDANVDGIVDGLDLAILGRFFGSTYCDGIGFYNNADFNDDDVIDGQDLAQLASYFGTRP